MTTPAQRAQQAQNALHAWRNACLDIAAVLDHLDPTELRDVQIDARAIETAAGRRVSLRAVQPTTRASDETHYDGDGCPGGHQ